MSAEASPRERLMICSGHSCSRARTGPGSGSGSRLHGAPYAQTVVTSQFGTFPAPGVYSPWTYPGVYHRRRRSLERRGMVLTLEKLRCKPSGAVATQRVQPGLALTATLAPPRLLRPTRSPHSVAQARLTALLDSQGGAKLASFDREQHAARIVRSRGHGQPATPLGARHRTATSIRSENARHADRRRRQPGRCVASGRH